MGRIANRAARAGPEGAAPERRAPPALLTGGPLRQVEAAGGAAPRLKWGAASEERAGKMRTEYLRELLAAASAMSFTAAARKLYMSQPKMSMHIAAMEKELGFPLFDREGGLSLTREGEVFCEKAAAILDEYDAAVEACRSLRRTTEAKLVFGEFQLIDLFPASCLGFLYEATGRIREARPSFEVTSRPLDNTLTIAESFQQGLCDASFRTCCLAPGDVRDQIFELDDGMGALPLTMDPMVAFARSGHPLASLAEVRPEDVARYPVVLSSLPSMSTWNSTRRDFFAAHGLEPAYHTHVASSPSAVVWPVDSDEVYLVASEYAASRRTAAMPGMAALEIAVTRVQSAFCLCYPLGSENPVLPLLVEEMRRLAYPKAPAGGACMASGSR